VLIYLDSNIVIYQIERHPVWGPRVKARLQVAHAVGDEIVVSDLTRLECRVGPLARGNATLLAQFDHFFGLVDVYVVSLTPRVCDLAAEIRARYRYQLAHSLSLAAAIDAGCGIFLTNDARLGGFAGLAVEVLP
jgi:predicted nucleic acid-binding protein